MGCDIHIWAEVKRSYPNKLVAQEWKAVGKVFKNEYFTADEPTTMYEDGYTFNEKLIDKPYDGRNYDLFAILADVRNGEGFAGIDTGDGFNPIAEPRGVPDDASDFYLKQVKDWEADGHSHSFFTLAELKAYDWDQTTKHRGWVDVEQFKVFQSKGKPGNWSGGVSGSLVEHISNAEMKRRIKEKNLISVNHYYTLVEWEETYAESVGDFLTKTIPELEKLLKLKMVHDVRIVFFFDN